MTVSNISMMSKGAGNLKGSSAGSQSHDFTYVVADEDKTNFHAFFDEHESWINHRDDGRSLNVDAEMVNKLLAKGM